MFIILFFLFSENLFADDFLIRSPQVYKEEFTNFLNINPQYKSIEQNWREQLDKNSKQLEKKYIKAKFELLNGSAKTAEQFFKQIVEQAYNQDWKESDRKIIVLSHLRLAQIDNINWETWLQKAFEFEANFTLDNNIFPPPFQQKWLKLRDTKTTTKWQPQLPINLIDKVVINSKVFNYQLYSSYSLNDSNNRVTIISNCGFIESLTGSALQIRNHQWTLPRYAQGSCSDHQILPIPNISTFKVLYPQQCVIVAPSPIRNLPLKLSPDITENNKERNSELQEPFKKVVVKDLPQTESSSLIKNKWLWMGVSLLAGYYIYNHNNKQRETQVDVQVKPTHRKDD